MNPKKRFVEDNCSNATYLRVNNFKDCIQMSSSNIQAV